MTRAQIFWPFSRGSLSSVIKVVNEQVFHWVVYNGWIKLTALLNCMFRWLHLDEFDFFFFHLSFLFQLRITTESHTHFLNVLMRVGSQWIIKRFQKLFLAQFYASPSHLCSKHKCLSQSHHLHGTHLWWECPCFFHPCKEKFKCLLRDQRDLTHPYWDSLYFRNWQ